MIFGCFLEDFRLHLGSPEGHFGGHFGARFANRSDYVDFLVIFSGLGKRSENGAPQGGVDMRSVHAGACFVRIGRCCLGSILDSILESFWEPSSPLYSFLSARVANRAPN